MEKIAFLLKTYKDDHIYYKRLVETFFKYNVDHIKLYVVVPQKDIHLFRMEDPLIEVIGEENLPVNYFQKKCNGFSPGYLNQQIVKLAFWELGLCENYFCIDADCYFIKNFYVSDFIYQDNIPYSIFWDDRELMEKPYYYEGYGKARERYNRIICNELQADKRLMKSCHGCAIFSRHVLESFKNEFLSKKGWDYRDIIAKAPLEFTWYNYWLLKSHTIEIYEKVPLVKYYHTTKQLLTDICHNVSIWNLRKYYIGVIVQSNFGKSSGIYDYEEACNNKKWLMITLAKEIKEASKKMLGSKKQ